MPRPYREGFVGPYRKGETYFDGRLFAAFCDRYRVVSFAEHEREGGHGSGGGRAVFLNGIRLGRGRDMDLLAKLRAGKTKTISLPRAEELLVRHDLLLVDFEFWYEEKIREEQG